MNIFVTVLFLACLVVLHAGTLRPKIEEAITENNLRNIIGVGDCDCSNPYCCPSSGYVCTDNCPTGGGKLFVKLIVNCASLVYNILTSCLLFQASSVAQSPILCVVVTTRDVALKATTVAMDIVALVFSDLLS